MSKNKNKKRTIKRSDYSGKIVNGKPVILVDEVMDYVKQMGYHIKPVKEIIINSALVSVGLMISIAIFLIPFISAQTTLFTMDFAERINQIILIIMFAISGVLYWFRSYLFGGALLLLMSFIMIFNDINPLLSLIVGAIGVITIFRGGNY